MQVIECRKTVQIGYAKRRMEDKMDILNKAKTGKKERPIKVVQFGEGNFLRGFVDYMIDIANEHGKFDGDIVLIKPIGIEYA